jgi:acyl-coenzyme A synthetase/AMP-(fatty) acid ligase/aryl carrier-like protein
VTQRNVVRLFQTTAPLFPFNQDDVWTLFHSCAFDFSVWEMWGALLHGGRLVVVPYTTSRSPDAFLSLLARERVTVLNQTPSAFRQLIHAHAQAGMAGDTLALRYVVFGGEALELQSLKPWFDRCGDARPQLVNMYGITETTVHVTFRQLRRGDADSGSVIGGALPDLQLYVLDANREPVPVGVPGELYVAGPGLARGYLNRPELTSERFVPHPFRPGERCYRTGDLARWLPGRDVEYLGRIDHQVKIRGFRIEPGEIESVLCQHPRVREAVVVARTDESGHKQLAAYLVAASPAPDPAELREHLGAKLPDYMVPAAFVLLDRMPLTDHGKVDRKALPEPAPLRPQLRSTYLAPRTATERTLEEIWRRVLRLDRVGTEDNFFEAGGDSLRIVSLLGALRAAGYADLQITDLFQHPTVAALAAHLDRPHPGASSQRVIERARRQARATAARAAELAPTES